MDALFFLKRRTQFIRQYYDRASVPFLEIIRKIEAGDEPYEPPYQEVEEPPYLEDWAEAKTSLEILGATCISMLSESLKLYFLIWETQLGVKCQKQLKAEFKKGFVHGYMACFDQVLKLNWVDCPVDFAILDQMVLARNDTQHPKKLTVLGIEHAKKTLEKHAAPFFLNKLEKSLVAEGYYNELGWLSPLLVVTPDALNTAILETESLGEWMEKKLLNVKYG